MVFALQPPISLNDITGTLMGKILPMAQRHFVGKET